MLGVTDLPTYLAGLVLIVLLPGPNSLYVLSVAARRGVRTGYVAAAGVWTGDTVLMTLSALGASSLLQTTPVLWIPPIARVDSVSSVSSRGLGVAGS